MPIVIALLGSIRNYEFSVLQNLNCFEKDTETISLVII